MPRSNASPRAGTLAQSWSLRESEGGSMSRVDFDQIAEAISPEQLAQAIGAKKRGRDFHCPSSAHENGTCQRQWDTLRD